MQQLTRTTSNPPDSSSSQRQPTTAAAPVNSNQRDPALTPASYQPNNSAPAVLLFVAGDQPDLAGKSLKVHRSLPHAPYRFSISLVDLVSIDGIESCRRLRPRTRENRGKRVTGSHNLRVGSWNIGSLSGKSLELVKILKKRKINIACVQETRWVGSKAREVDGFKLWYSGGSRDRNGVGILVDGDLREQVVEVRRINDRLMTIKIVIGGCTLSVISAYAPQVGLGRGGQKLFYEELDEKENHLVTFRSSIAKTQIDYLLLRKGDRGLCKDCKVIPSENLTTQHKLLVMDLEIKRVLGVARGNFGGHRGDWWWNGEVQGLVEAKKAAYTKWVECVDEEEKRTLKEVYKTTKTEAKLVVTRLRQLTLSSLYVFGDKGGDKKLYRLAKARERKARDLDQVKCIKDEEGKVLVEESSIKQRWRRYFHKLLNEEGDRDIVLGDLAHSKT
ncbi:hypothetical protein H5410_045936 [Solanum commersonii]|uniref:Endonuclease/exonuclease/phosphatase domain-containing protein n=1 Tax=Solanum commersonii TaxID=4109 RepID=A0A9J5XE76_SOLCO|nr:hypothetical protein H5410_045936 [Solanum commersonii]